MQTLFIIALHNFLQNGLAVIKQLFVLDICQDKLMYKLLCRFKTTI